MKYQDYLHFFLKKRILFRFRNWSFFVLCFLVAHLGGATVLPEAHDINRVNISRSAFAAPSFVDGATATLSVNQNAVGVGLTKILRVLDDTGDVLTWSVVSGPSHGALGGFPATETYTSGYTGIPAASGLTYTPTTDYSGADGFTIQVSDGAETDTIVVNVTVVPTHINSGNQCGIEANNATSVNSLGVSSGQSFTACSSGILTTIKYLGNTSFPINNNTVSIYKGEGISGDFLGSMQYTNSAPVATYSDYTVINVSGLNIDLTSGDVYTFVLTPPNTYTLAALYDNDIYGGGQLYVGGGAQGAYDMIFAVEIDPAVSNSSPTFNDGPVATLTVEQDSGSNSLASFLDITDLDTGDPLSWSIVSGTSHGSLLGFPKSGTSNGGSVTPSGLSYIPTAGYSGTDTFVIQISDGTDTAQITINVTVNPSSLDLTTSPLHCHDGNDAAVDVTVNHAGGVTYNYTLNKDGSSFLTDPNSSSNSNTFSGLGTGDYTILVEVFDGSNNSLGIDSETFTITNPAELNLSVTSLGNVSGCAGSATGWATVTASGGTGSYTYSWSPYGGSAATATGLTAGAYIVTVTDANGCSKAVNFNITQPPMLTATLNVTNVGCFGESNGTASVSVSGGLFPYTYSWSPNGGTGSTATGLAAGNYTVTISDDNGCQITENVTITQPSALTATTSSVDVGCNGDSSGTATVSVSGGSGPYSYSWSPSGGTGSTAAGLVAGSYTVTVTDANGCQLNKSVTISQPTALTATTSAVNVSCNGGSNGTATVNVSGGSGPYSYSWSPSGGTGSTATGLVAGSYTVTVTDTNGCQLNKSITITQPTALTATTSVVNVSCNGGSNGSASVNISGGVGPYSYSWSPSGGTGSTASGLTAGTYTVVVTDNNGCQTTSAINILEPDELVVTASSTNIGCVGGNDGIIDLTVQGGTLPYTFLWSNGSLSEDLSGLVAGTYQVEVTDANGCTAIKSVVLTDEDHTLPVVITHNIQVILDANGQASITAEDVDNGSYDNCSIALMELDRTTFSCGDLGDNEVTLTVTDGGGNQAQSIAVVTVTGCLLEGATLAGGTFTYDGSAHGIAVQDLPEGASVSYTNNNQTNAGNYTVTAVVSKPFYKDLELQAVLTIEKATQSITFDPIPNKELGVDPNFQLEASASSGLPIQYTYTNDGTLPVATVSGSGMVTMLNAGALEITAVQEGNENYEAATSVTQNVLITGSLDNGPSLSSKIVPAQAFSPNGDGVNDTWVVPEIENHPNNVVRVYNRWGHEVFSVHGYQNDWNGVAENASSKLPPGSYFYTIDLGNGTKPLQGWIFLNY